MDEAEDMYMHALNSLEPLLGRSSKRCQDIISDMETLQRDRK
jgi:hypothetical protein